MERIVQELSGFKTSVSELSALLEEENVRILAGDFGQLKDIADRKMALVRDIEQFLSDQQADGLDDQSRNALKILQRLTEHNGALLKAAYNGSRAAQARLADIRNEHSSVGAYSVTGKSIRSSEAVVSRQKTV